MKLSEEQIKKYKDKDPIAVYPFSQFGGIAILDVIYGIYDYVVYRYFDKPYVAKIEYDEEDGSYFFIIHGATDLSINLGECITV